MAHLDDVVRFYEMLDDFAYRVGGPRTLADCTGRSGWPAKGVYFFFEPGEARSTSGVGPRVVRVGTHALAAAGRASLWQRLSAHQGSMSGAFAGGGNHRASVFRLHVGAALLAGAEQDHPTWGRGTSAPREVRVAEHPIECRVSEHIRSMPLVWLDVSGGADGGCAIRARIEANTIALLSSWRGLETLNDPPSAGWLGRHSPNQKVSRSGLWNVRHVDEDYDPAFVDEMRGLIEACRPSSRT